MELLDVMKKKIFSTQIQRAAGRAREAGENPGSSTRCTNSYQCAAGAADRGTE